MTRLRGGPMANVEFEILYALQRIVKQLDELIAIAHDSTSVVNTDMIEEKVESEADPIVSEQYRDYTVTDYSKKKTKKKK